MYRTKDNTYRTLPSNWEYFHNIKNSRGKSFIKDPAQGQIKGLYYKIDPFLSLEKQRGEPLSHFILLKSWSFNIYNQWHEYPVLSFLIKDRVNKDGPVGKYISSVKIMTQIFPTTDLLAHRLLAATSLFIRQIENGIVSDPEQILRLHKIHPRQKCFYTKEAPTMLSILNGIAAPGKENHRKLM